METENPNPMPWSTCPVCGYRFDSATHLLDKNARPGPGDLSLCMKCGELMVYQKDMTLIQANLDDVTGLELEQFLMLDAAQKMIREKRLLDKKYHPGA